MGFYSVNYDHVFEVEGSPDEEMSRENGFVGKITYQCDFNDRIQLMIDKLNADGGLGQIYPHNSVHNARACQASSKPAGGIILPAGAFGLGYYEHALVTIVHKTPGLNSHQPEDSDLISETIEGHTEFMTVASKGLYWDTKSGKNSDKKVYLSDGEAPGIIMREFDYCVTLHQVLTLPAGLLDIGGTCNKDRFSSKILGFDFDKETVIPADPVLTRKFTTLNGAGSWNVGLRFNYRKSGWNTFLNPNTGEFEKIWKEDPAGGSPTEFKPYTPTSYADLLPFYAE